MRTSIKNLPQSQVEITIELTPEELKPHLEQAAKQLSKEVAIPGWRPGMAPYEVIKQQLGEMKIYEKALNKVVDKTLWQTLKEKNLETIGQPEVTVEKIAPSNNFIYHAKVSLLPEVKVADWLKIKINRRAAAASEEELNKVLADIRKNLAAEALVNRGADTTDKIVVDMNLFLDKVPVEGGQTKDHQILLDENYYVPGLPQQLLGLKTGEEKTFTLAFPTEHFQKNLAGKNVEFKVTVKGVFERTIPELNDSFALKLGQPSLLDLKNLIRQNLETEKTQREERRLEVELLQNLVKSSRFAELPQILLESEKRKMFNELKTGLEERGLNFEQYLKDINKTPEQIAKDFESGATERVKTALLVRQIAKQEKIICGPEELANELAKLKELYKDTANIEERFAEPDIADVVAANIVNRKVMDLLKKQMVGLT